MNEPISPRHQEPGLRAVNHLHLAHQFPLLSYLFVIDTSVFSRSEDLGRRLGGNVVDYVELLPEGKNISS